MASFYPPLVKGTQFNRKFFEFQNAPVSYSQFRNEAQLNIAGVDSVINVKEINNAGVQIQNEDLVISSNIIGAPNTVVFAGTSYIPNLNTQGENLVIQSSSGNHIFLGYNDGDGHIYVNTDTNSNMYIDGGDLIMNNTNQKLRMGTSDLYFNENNKWNSNELKVSKVNLKGTDLENKLGTIDNLIVSNKVLSDLSFNSVITTASSNKLELQTSIAQNKSESDSRFTLVEQTAESNKTQLQNSITNVNSTLTENISTLNTNLTQQINTNQSLNNSRFTTVESTAETNRSQLQTTIETLNTSLTNSLNNVNTALTQQISQNKNASDARFLVVESTTENNKSQLQSDIAALNSSLSSNITNVNTNLTQLIGQNKTASDIHFTNVESTAESNKVLLQNSIQSLDDKVNTHKSLADASFNSFNLSKADIVYVDNKVAELVSGAPSMLNTLNKLAEAISNDNNFSSTIVSLVGTKAEKSYTDAQDGVLQNAINLKADSSYVTSQLDTKVATSDYETFKTQNTSLLNAKVNTSDYNSQVSQLQSSIDTKSSQSYVDSAVTQLSNSKVDNTTFQSTTANLQSQLDTKASSEYVNGQLNVKVNSTTFDSTTSNLQSQLDTKSSSEFVNQQLATKVNQTDFQTSLANVQTQLDTKASLMYVNTQLGLKANQSSLETTATQLQTSIDNISSQLLSKVDASSAEITTSNLNSLINEKASSIYVDTQLATKANKSYVDEQLSGVDSSLILKADKTYVDSKITDLVGSSPQTLDTLQEIANAIAEDANFSVTIINSIASKASQSYVNTELNTLQTQINDRPTTTYVNTQLALKGDKSYIDNQLELKSNTSDVTSALATKASVTELNNLNSLVNTKVDASYVQLQVGSANTYTDNAVTGLASQTYVDNKVQITKDEILGGASPAYDTLLELQNALSNNTDAVTAITNQLATKASSTYVDNAVSNLQSNLQTDINSKASITYVDSQIASIPPPPSLTGYATETYVNTAIQNVQTGGVDLSTYATKTYVDTAVANVSVDLSGIATELYVNNAVANVSVDLTGYATQTYVTSALDTAKNEILGGAGAAFDTLNELKGLIDSGDASVSTALATQIAAKANDNEVVHLAGTETITGLKSFSNNVTVSSLNNINSTTIGYLSNVTSDIQTQLNSKMNSTGGAFVDLTTNDQTITGNKIFNNINTYSRSIERILTPSLSGTTITYDYTANAGVGYVNPTSATLLTMSVTNLPTSTNLNNSSFTISLIINTATFKTRVSTLNVNGTGVTIRYVNGSASINIASAVWVLQTFTIMSLPNAGSTLIALSSVSPWF